MATYEQLNTLSKKLNLDKKQTEKVITLLEKDITPEKLIISMEKLVGKEKANEIFKLTDK